MPPKKTISEEAFNAFKHEVERNSQYLVNQLLQKINKLEEKCNNAESENNKKIEKLEEKHDKKIKEIEEEHRNKIEELEGEINRIECKPRYFTGRASLYQQVIYFESMWELNVQLNYSMSPPKKKQSSRVNEHELSKTF